MRREILQHIVSIVLGLLFIGSAILKLYPVEPFEYSLVDAGINSWFGAALSSRLLIALELLIGSFFLFRITLRRFTIPLASFLLLFFTIYLLIQLKKYGNSGNCGCMGNIIQISPLEGVVKNLLMLAGCLYLYRTAQLKNTGKIIVVIISATSFILPFALNPLPHPEQVNNSMKPVSHELPLDLLYNDSVNTPPNVELRKGKWVLAFLSLHCHYCRMAATKLQIIKKKDPSLPVYMILNGDKEDLPGFFEETRSSGLPWSLFNGADKFRSMAGSSLPKIYFIEDSKATATSNFYFLTDSEIRMWLEK